MATTIEEVGEALRDQGWQRQRGKEGRPKLRGCCVLHEEDTPSADFYLDDGWYFCHGCKADHQWADGAVPRALGMAPPRRTRRQASARQTRHTASQGKKAPRTGKDADWNVGGKFAPPDAIERVTTYLYVRDGRLLYDKIRYRLKNGDKTFRCRRPVGDDQYAENLNGVDRIPYLHDELKKADRDDRIMVCAGEKDADTLRGLGYCATTNDDGEGKWSPNLTHYFEDRCVVLVPDQDGPGTEGRELRRENLAPVADELRVVNVPEGKDATEWVERRRAAGLSDDQIADEFETLIETTAVSTAVVLAGVLDFLRKYVILPGAHFYDVVALWTLHAHAIGAFDTTPRLIFKSPEKESGKTRALEVLELLALHPLMTINATVAAVFRLLRERQVTILFDEVDAIFNPKKAKDNEELRAILNSGYRRGATVLRVVGEGKGMKVETFPVFAATALAAIGNLPDTIESRAITVPMRRRAPNEKVQSFRHRQASAEVLELRGQLDAWGGQYQRRLAKANPEMPEEVTDRAADCWEPLLAIADLAGGEWSERAREVAISIVSRRVEDDQSWGVRLLADIKRVYQEKCWARAASEDLVSALCALPESPWGDMFRGVGLNQRGLADRLKPYGIGSVDVRVLYNVPFEKNDDGSPKMEWKTKKGYQLDQFKDAWSRYLRDTDDAGASVADGAHAHTLPTPGKGRQARHPRHRTRNRVAHGVGMEPLSPLPSATQARNGHVETPDTTDAVRQEQAPCPDCGTTLHGGLVGGLWCPKCSKYHSYQAVGR